MDSAAFAETLQSHLPDLAVEPVAAVDYATVYVPAERIRDVLAALRDAPGQGYTLLAELTAADYLPRDPRFEVVYHLVRLGAKDAGGAPNVLPARVRVKVRVGGEAPTVPSVVPLFPVADWCEREVWDLFGIVFDGHPGLVRILTPDDWEGHPLRKDYPVQVKVPVSTTAPLQISEQEFFENIERQRSGSWKHRG
jgi:NADH-quinone oxidoreductase subunit C